MSPNRMPTHVVVGVDDHGSAHDALDWATAEAAARGCPLRLVHAFQPPLPADPYGAVPATGGIPMAWAEADEVLAQAMARARSVAPDIHVTTRLRQASAARALLDEARDARLLVLGRRSRRGLRGLLSRSVTGQIAARSGCPVVVIRTSRGLDASSSLLPRVVVGVDAAESCTPAVGYAFQAARQRGVPLIAVHAWSPDPPADLEAVAAPASLAEARAGDALERALDRWQSEFPGVSAHAALVRGDPARALIGQSRGAALLVVGTRRRGQVMRTVRGSVSLTVLRHAQSPVAIIRHGSTVTPRSPASPGDEQRWGRDGTAFRIIPRNRRWPA
jgi:nucleotide-binding universal stress UspA family protein